MAHSKIRKLLFTLLTVFFMNSIVAESTAQLESVINESAEKLRTLDEKDKVDFFLKNRKTNELVSFFSKNSKKLGKHIVIVESISAFSSSGGYSFDIYDYDNKIFYSFFFGKKKKVNIDFPQKLNNTAYVNSLGVKDGGLIIMSVLDDEDCSFCAYYGGLEYDGPDSDIVKDYESMLKFLKAKPMR
ncbi:MAG: hypothetical protein VZR56_02610 [Treponema sp.]|nr:hypothetical protein [Treponema sp.]